MRKNRTLILMLLSLFCLFSCSDDEKNGQNELSTNYISFYGRVCPLQMGALYHDVSRQVIYSSEVKEVVRYLDRYGEGAKEIVDTLVGYTKGLLPDFTGNFMLGLYDPSFGINPVLKQASGLGGAAICIRFASSSQEKLVSGKYVYSTNNEANTFIAYSSIFYDPSGTSLGWTEKGESYTNKLVEGEIDVKEEGDGYYTIKFDLVTTRGGSVKGQFQGKLQSYDIRPTEGAPKIEIVDLKSRTLRAIWDGYVNASDPEATGFEADMMHFGVFVSNFPTRPVLSISLLEDVYKEVIKPSDPDMVLCYIPDADYYYNSTVTTHGKFFFDSPLYLRAWTRGQFPIRYTCHTRFAPAPDFTMERFNNLQPEDLVFSTGDEKCYLEESECRNNAATYLPKFFYIETGNGRRGVICVTGFDDIGSGPSLKLTVRFADLQQTFSKMR